MTDMAKLLTDLETDEGWRPITGWELAFDLAKQWCINE